MRLLSNSLPFFVLVVITVFNLAVVGQNGSPKVAHQEEFTVIGIEAHTSGERELSGEGEVGSLWQRFYQEHVADKISNRADKNVYALYTEYTRDRMGEYNVIIGVKVKTENGKPQVPGEMVLKTVPAGQYAVVTSEKGPAETVIPTAWQKIWAFEDKEMLGGKRAYKTDFELYNEHATDPQSLQADLYIGILPADK